MFNLKIVNGILLDGTGAPARSADLAIAGDRIADIGNLSRAEAAQTLDATGCLVCPGFIDVHTHSDAYILIEPVAPSKLYQGVTTEIGGNCGCSGAPLLGEARLPSDWAIHTYPGAWRTVADYRAQVEQVVPGPNIALLAGHNTLRAGVTGYAARAATPGEIAIMVRNLEQALDEGACGLSTGLVYTPGRYADAVEINALVTATARHGRICASHMRSETGRLLEALDETLGFGLRTGVRVQISHLKTAGPRNWHLLEPALDRIHAAQARGVEVTADRYPYTASCTDLDIIFPDWAAGGGHDAVLERLRDPAQRGRLRDELIQTRDDVYWQSITVGSTAHPGNHRFQGQPLTAVATVMNVHPAEAVLALTETDGLRTSAFFHGMSEANMHRILALPFVMPASDASLRAPAGPLSHDWPHPRAYGTFPRFLRLALDGRTVPLPEAIRKMTTLPARTFNLTGRGELRTGYAADIVVLDPRALRDCADYPRPHALAEGIRHVLVNGVHTLTPAGITGHRGGRFL